MNNTVPGIDHVVPVAGGIPDTQQDQDTLRLTSSKAFGLHSHHYTRVPTHVEAGKGEPRKRMLRRTPSDHEAHKIFDHRHRL